MSIKIPQKLSSAIARFPQEERDLVFRAYNFAKEKHSGQKRKSGAPYITHPLRIAIGLAADNYDLTTVAAGLLHDTLEDTETTAEELKSAFGIETAKLVDGVSKVAAMRTKSKTLTRSESALFLSQVDNYRKILLATASDVRVMIIRLYDRLDNVATLQWLKPEKQMFYARETIEIYAPIAERLGMGIVKGKLEDRSFPYAYPEEYRHFIKVARNAYKNPEKVIEKEIPKIKSLLDRAGIQHHSIAGRAKHLYSLYNKLKRTPNIKNIFDIIAIRVIVGSVEDCYKALGVIHSCYQPLPGQIDDYIARPKESGYQSLHTTVKNEEDDIFEIQIRTTKMHKINEHGLAAHWSYKDSRLEKSVKAAKRNQEEWQRELEKIKNIEDRKDFLRQFKEEFFSRQVFVFTPKGKIIKLPAGSTCVDFAYNIHSEIGDHCSGVMINNRIMPMGTELQTGDTVEIITSKKACPSNDWLKLAKTANAKHHIRNFLRAKNFDALVERGTRVVHDLASKHKLPPFDKTKIQGVFTDSRLPYKNIDNALAALAEGTLNKSRLLKIIYPDFSSSETKKVGNLKESGRVIRGLDGVRHVAANCCKPKSTDRVIGYVGSEHIIKVHKTSCNRLKGIDERRLVELS